MKTLYININNENIQSNDELEVLNYDLDSDFLFYLGERIAKGCKVQNENALITDFNTPDNKQDYDAILSQWNDIKKILFGENVEGTFKFVLPSGYIHWLRYHEDYNHVYEANFSNDSARTIAIDLTELYEDTVDDLQRKIMRKLKRDELYLNIDELVFNDENVIRKSLVVRALKEKNEGIGFKPYKKWEQEHKQDLEQVDNVKPNTNTASFDDFFPYKGITLGETPIDSVEEKNLFENDGILVYKADADICFLGISGQKCFVAFAVDTVNKRIPPQKWSDILGCKFGESYEQCYKSLAKKGVLVTYKEEKEILAISPSQKYLVFFIFDDDTMKFMQLMILLNKCPYCDSRQIELKKCDTGEYVPYCAECHNFYLPVAEQNGINADEESDDVETPSYPSCYSDNVSDDGSDYLQYTCQDCGHNWGHDDTLTCPECGSDNIENDGTDCYPYECNACGHMWGEEEDDNDEEDNDYDDDTDNDGNPMSEYYESFGFIVGKTTKLDIKKKGGILIDPEYDTYKMPNGVEVNFFNNSTTVNYIQIGKESMNSIPLFYKNLGIYWGMNKNEFRSVFESLGFSVHNHENAIGDCISAYKHCARFDKCVDISIQYDSWGMWAFGVR